MHPTRSWPLPPRAQVEAFFYPAGDAAQRRVAEEARGRFVQRYGLGSDAAPVLQANWRNLDAPFALPPQYFNRAT